MEVIKIRDTAYGGSGVGRNSEGKAIFVPYTVTGDIVNVQIVDDKGSYLIGNMIDLVEPSVHRKKPLCPYYGICGGCQFGHIKNDYQIELKKMFLQGGLRKYKRQLPEIEYFSASSVGYRIRATVRSKNGSVGFYKQGSNNFIPVENCLIMSNTLFNVCLEWAKEYTNNIDKTVTLSVIESNNGKKIAYIESRENLDIKGSSPFDGIKIKNTGKKYGVDHLIFETPYGKIPVGYGGFFQSNKYLLDKFQSYPLIFLSKTMNVLELYSGSGYFTSALKENVKKLSAVELNLEAASLGAKYGYPIRCGSTADLSHLITDIDSLVLDPPRDGVDKKTMQAILRSKVENIIYVSCNPMTLARDVMRLSSYYDVESIALFDMYPDTYHSESVLKLKLIK